jgi:type IV secretory pathway protease TraF
VNAKFGTREFWSRFLGGLLIGYCLVVAFRLQPYRIGFNVTPSEAEGVYLVKRVSPDETLRPGELVIYRYTAPWHEPPYDDYPDGTGFLKHLAAVPGQDVETKDGCNWLVLGERKLSLGCILERTPSGRMIPRHAVFSGPLPEGRYYLSSEAVNGYDSRYFGAVPREAIEAVAEPILVWDP